MSSPPRKIFTIGVYGFNENNFFTALEQAGIDTFADIRARRGMRGKKYSFANSNYLQNRLQEKGIRYLHIKELAPTESIRLLQKGVDKGQKILKRQRVNLSPAFIEAYNKLILDRVNLNLILNLLPLDASRIAFFCVEGEPKACHRSLVASRLGEQYDYIIEDILPWKF